MPFTPFHMGPGIAIKALMGGSFSLMIFGWTQIVMDIQPLIVLMSGAGHLHGFSHTYIGATLIAIVAGLTGKYLAQIGLRLLRIAPAGHIGIAWWVVFVSAFIGSFSHVLLDIVMHSDVEPFFPVAQSNVFLGMLSVAMLHQLCLWSGLVGAGLYCVVQWRQQKVDHQRR